MHIVVSQDDTDLSLVFASLALKGVVAEVGYRYETTEIADVDAVRI